VQHLVALLAQLLCLGAKRVELLVPVLEGGQGGIRPGDDVAADRLGRLEPLDLGVEQLTAIVDPALVE
jgi:hypothetical protein